MRLVTLDQGETLIQQFYEVYLGRKPDSEGLECWQTFLNKGHSSQELERGISDSLEAENRNKQGAFALSKSLSLQSDFPKCDVIVPFLDHASMTIQCLERLRCTTPDFYLVVVNDHSNPDQAIQVENYLKSAYLGTDSYVILTNEKNLGFQDSIRRALPFCRNDFIVVLNNDVLVAPKWKAKLIAPFAHDPRLMLTGPFGGVLDKDFLGCVQTGSGKVDYIEFSCAMFRASLLHLIPIWDSKLEFAYGEDSDLSLRVLQLGMHIQTIQETEIQHLGNQTFGQLSSETKWKRIMEKNLKYLCEKWSDYDSVQGFSFTDVIFRRDAAAGDVLCLDPVIRAFKKKYPEKRITLESNCSEILKFHPLIGAFAQPEQAHLKNAEIIDFNLVYEKDPKKHLVDAYLCHLGLDRPTPPYPFFFRDTFKKVTGQEKYLPYVVACSEGSWENREIPAKNFREILIYLKWLGYEVFEVGLDPSAFLGIGGDLKKKTSVQDLTTIIQESTFVVGHDSLILHLAEALGKQGAYGFSCILPQMRLHRKGLSIPVRKEELPCLGCHHNKTPPCIDSTCELKGEQRNVCVRELTLQQFCPALETLKRSTMNEVTKYKDFLVRYVKGAGLDLGSGDQRTLLNALTVDCRELANVDIVDDIQTLNKLRGRERVDFILASHCLEHLKKPVDAIDTWWGLLKEKGYMIVILPHADLYMEPNPEHLHKFRPDDARKFLKREDTKEVLFLTDEGLGEVSKYSFILVYQKLGV